MYDSDVSKDTSEFCRCFGCVAGRLIYPDREDSAVGKGALSYWNYESLLRQWESDVCSLIGTSGCLYAVRRSAYVPMYPDACSDFLIATILYRQGLRTIFEPAAVCVEDTNRDSSKEFSMRVRVIAQTLNDLWRNRDMMNPFKSGFFAIELISHKLLRYSVPLFLVGILLSSAFLAYFSTTYLVIFLLQVIFLFSYLGSLFMRGCFTKSNLPITCSYKRLSLDSGDFLMVGYAHWDPVR